MSSGRVKCIYNSEPKLFTVHLYHHVSCVVKVLWVITYCHMITRKNKKVEMMNISKIFNNGLPDAQKTPLPASWYVSDEVHQ